MSTAKRLTIDSADFVRVERHIDGQAAIASFTRLTEDLPEQASQGEASIVHWSLKGYKAPRGESMLRLSVQAAPLVECQRCLGAFHYPIDAETTLELVKSEQDLALDVDGSTGEIDHDASEKILTSSHLDVLDLVEDELILCLPYVPTNDICPDQVALPEDNLEKEVSPFAVLEKLKK